MTFTFKRGIHPNEQKEYTDNVPIDYILPAAKSEMPLLQHLGSVCEPLVSVGQRVLAGEKIGDSSAFVSSPVHSSVSGVVKDIRPHLTVMGTIVNSIIIENDGEMQEYESINTGKDYTSLSRRNYFYSTGSGYCRSWRSGVSDSCKTFSPA